MINSRYVTTAICLAMSGFIIQPDSLAIDKRKSKSHFNTNHFVFVRNNSSDKYKSKSYILARANDSDGAETISKKWSKLGIIVTLALFVFVLLTLFKKEARHPRKEAKISVTILDENNLDLTKTAALSPAIAQIEEPIKDFIEEPVKNTVEFSMIGMDTDEEFDYELTAEEQATQSEVTIFETSRDVVLTSDEIIDSDSTGKLTVATSNSTKIDVVFELIQDLQKSNDLQDSKTQKKLRRKAIWELSQCSDFRAVEPLIQTISKVDSLEKGLILDAITQIAKRTLVNINNALLTSLSDESAEVRKNAIQDLTSLYQSASSITLRLSHMIDDRDLEVQQTAEWALEQLGQMSDPVTSIKSNGTIDQNLASDHRNGNSHY